ASSITGTWKDTNSNEKTEISLVVNGADSTVVMTPQGNPWWNKTVNGSWNGGSSAKNQGAQGDDAPYVGKVTFLNNANQSYISDFCVSLDGKRMIFGNGVTWEKVS
ncbi:MAG: hypothetical protein AAF639_38880, partial [Chloroflexota bacterium]